MTSHHVGKQTYDQGHRLDKQTQDLYRNEYKLNSQWNSRWIEDMPPVVFVELASITTNEIMPRYQ